MPHLNIIGPQVRRLRDGKGWTQVELSAKCGLIGWDVSRGTVAKIEAQVRCVSEVELWVIAEALGCSLEALYPEKRREILKSLQRSD